MEKNTWIRTRLSFWGAAGRISSATVFRFRNIYFHNQHQRTFLPRFPGPENQSVPPHLPWQSHNCTGSPIFTGGTGSSTTRSVRRIRSPPTRPAASAPSAPGVAGWYYRSSNTELCRSCNSSEDIQWKVQSQDVVGKIRHCLGFKVTRVLLRRMEMGWGWKL